MAAKTPTAYISTPPEPLERATRRQPLLGAQLVKAPSKHWLQNGLLGKWITHSWPIVKAYTPAYEAKGKVSQSKLIANLCQQLFLTDPFLWKKVELARMERWLRFSFASVKWHMQQHRLRQGPIEVLDNNFVEYEAAFLALIAECEENAKRVAANASIEQSGWGGKREGAGRPKSSFKYTRALHKTIKRSKNV